MSGTASSFRLAVWEWTQTALIATNLAWTTLCLGGARAQTVVVTSALTALLLIVHAVGWVLAAPPHSRATAAVSDRGGPVRRLHPAGVFFVPFLVYITANVLWVAPLRWLAWSDWFGWVQMAAVFWIVLNGIESIRARRFLFGILVALALVAVVLGCYQRFVSPNWLTLHRVQVQQYAGRASGSFGIPNSCAAFLLLLIPVGGAIACRRRNSPAIRLLFGWISLVLLFGVGLTISRGAWIGLAFALCVWPLISRRVAGIRRLALAGLAVGAVLVVGGTTYVASARVRDRLQHLVLENGEWSRPILWRAATRIVGEHPAFGSGAGTFDVAFEPYRPRGFLPRPVWAHNDYLNTLSDYGVTGFVLFFGAAALVIVRCRSDSFRRIAAMEESGSDRATVRNRPDAGSHVFDGRLVREAVGIGLLAFALQLFVDFHLKIPALAMAMAVMVALAVGDAWTMRPAPAASRGQKLTNIVVSAASVALALFIAVRIVPAERAEALRDAGRERLDFAAGKPGGEVRQRVASARELLRRAVALDAGNAQAWADLAYAMAQWSRLEPDQTTSLGRTAEEAAARAISLSPQVAENWVRRGVALDMQGRWTDAGDAFSRAITLSPNTPLAWYHYAYHLSLKPFARDLAAATVQTCLRIDPNYADGLRLRQRLATE